MSGPVGVSASLMDSGGECTNIVLQWYELINDSVSMCGCICVGCVCVCVLMWVHVHVCPVR